MGKDQNSEIKKLYIADFSVWNCEDEPDLLDEMITNAINLSEGVYAYRRYDYSLDGNDFIKWLQNETGLIYYKDASIEFTEDNIVEKVVPKNNESVYYLEINEDNKKSFLKHFKITLTSVRNRMGEININKYLGKRFYVDDSAYDRYDFIFTVGDKIILFTDIHDFTFVNREV